MEEEEEKEVEEEGEDKERQWPASETLLFFPHVFLFILQTKLAIV